MSIRGTQALAGLQLLVAVAQADSALTPGERSAIATALADARLPRGITGRRLTDSSYDVDSLIAQIESRAARDVALGACWRMANGRGVRPPKQQALLDKIEKGWGVRSDERRPRSASFDESVHDLPWLTPLGPDDDGDRGRTLLGGLAAGAR